jgi:hypothetical protein
MVGRRDREEEQGGGRRKEGREGGWRREGKGLPQSSECSFFLISNIRAIKRTKIPKTPPMVAPMMAPVLSTSKIFW